MSAPVERLVSERLLRQAERLSLRIWASRFEAATGEHRGRGYGSSFELLDHRAYAPGDDFRRVDWNAFARLDTLNMRLSEPQQAIVLHLLIDRSESMEFGSPTKARLAQQVTAILAYVALAQLDGVRLYALQGASLTRSPRYRSKAQMADVFRGIEELERGGPTDLEACLRAFVVGHPERGLSIIVSDLLTPTDVRTRLKQLVKAGFDVAVLHVLSEEELHPSLAGNLEIVDSETGRAAQDWPDAEALEAYTRRTSRWRADLADEMRGFGVRYVPLISSTPIESVLVGDLRRSGILE